MDILYNISKAVFPVFFYGSAFLIKHAMEFWGHNTDMVVNCQAVKVLPDHLFFCVAMLFPIFHGICRTRTLISDDWSFWYSRVGYRTTCLHRGAASVLNRKFGKALFQSVVEDSPYAVLMPQMPWMLC